MMALAEKLREERGDISSSLISLMIITCAFALILSALPVFSKVYYLNAYLDDVTRYIELTGGTSGLSDELQALNEIYYPSGARPVLNTSGMTFIPGTNRIQLGESFSLSAFYYYDFSVTGFFSIPVRISARSTGRSEVYYKQDA